MVRLAEREPIYQTGGTANQRPSFPFKLEELLEATNEAREHPSDFAEFINKTYSSNSNERDKEENNQIQPIRRQIDAEVLKEVQDFLKKQPPLLPLKLDRGLTTAAYLHSVYLSEQGRPNHIGRENSKLEDRISQFGEYLFGSISENILNKEYYHPKTWIAELIIDDSMASRGHRKNIFDKEATQVGLGCFGSAEDNDYWFTMNFAGKGYRSDANKIPKDTLVDSGLNQITDQ